MTTDTYRPLHARFTAYRDAPLYARFTAYRDAATPSAEETPERGPNKVLSYASLAARIARVSGREVSGNTARFWCYGKTTPPQWAIEALEALETLMKQEGGAK